MVEHMNHPLFRITTLIDYKMGGKGFQATGFFFEMREETFLITNKHVFEHELGIEAEELNFHYLPNEGSTDTEIERVELNQSDWLTHPTEEADVAVLPLPDFDITTTGNRAFRRHELVERTTNYILSGNSAIVVGYPQAGWFTQDNFPLIRTAKVSSFFGTTFNDDQCFVTDAKLHEGMSGSPVLIDPSANIHDVTGQVKQFRYLDLDNIPELIGVHSGPIEQESELDLHKAWYADLMLEIIESNSEELFDE